MLHLLAAEANDSAGASKTFRILVVDDEADIRSAVKQLLERSLRNVTVYTAADGASGLELMASTPVDLILTDFKMPRMNGFQFVHEVMKVSPGTPRILITAFERELAEQANVSGTFNHVFTKPLDPRALVKMCQKMLESSSS